ncbi:hypothetical protein HMI54_006759 [Coelomomyces lativittatus]|nr:hypothetical protein HMI56_004377 [Coelomomyces lativittatus]KAJ1504649.1 hypothetical protein HMI54_006759 [Coelomomyces lativittatus]
MSLKDRTNEFFAALLTLEARQRLTHHHHHHPHPPTTTTTTSDVSSFTSHHVHPRKTYPSSSTFTSTSTALLFTPSDGTSFASNHLEDDPSEKSALLLASSSSSSSSSVHASNALKVKSEFSKMASQIAHGIQSTATKLEALGKCKTFFLVVF